MTFMNRHSKRQYRHVGVVARALCGVTLAGLTLATLPAVVTAAPVMVQAPRLPHVVVGLRQGANGTEVKAVQQALIDAGVKVPGGADGYFGSATKSALTAFQSRSGLTTTGEVDEATAAALGLTAPAAAAATSQGLSVGSQGDAVKELQNALMAFGVFVPGGADGVFGPATKTAVSNYQRWNGLAVTGEVDAATASKLELGTTPAAAPTTPTSPATPVAVASPQADSGSFVGLAVGARGENVKVLQRALIAAGISVRGGADGVFGPATAAALTSYQQANGLSANGIVDDAVVGKLQLVAGAPAAKPEPKPTAAGAAHVGLTVGSSGTLVKDLQRALMDAGLTLRGGADGVFGNMTKTTLLKFQKSQGREESGVVSAADAAALSLGTTAAPKGVASQVGFAVFGERGERVTAVQKSLLKAGITFAGGADGVFGASTAGAILAFQRREGLPATGKIDQATADRLGSTAAPAPAPPSSAGVTLDVFPVQGKCWFGDTWHAPRGGGRTHEGVDVIAARGNLLYAAVSGRISKVYSDFPGSLSGNGLRIALDNGTYITYLHLDTFAEGIELGVPVTAGQVVGTVGSTGNAATPHLHFEVHPSGGAAVNPYPLIKPIDACNITAPRA